MPSGIVDTAAFEDQNSVGLHQHREAVRNDHERAAFSDPQQIRIDDRFALGIESAGRLVEDQDLRTA